VELEENVPPFGDHSASAVHQFLLGTALARRGTFDEAHEALANADAYAMSSGDRELVAEAGYYRALTAFMRGDFVQAEAIAGEALDEQGGSGHARLLDLLGLIAGLHGDVERQIAMHLAASEYAVTIANRDIFFEANILNNLAIPVAETNPPEIAAFVRKRASTIKWHDELRSLQFHVVRHLAWLEALAGNHLAAYRHFRTAIGLGPTPARRTEAFVGLGYLAQEMGETINAAECIAEAEDLARQVDWSTSDDERLVLLHLAMLVAPSDPARAAQHIERYKALPKVMSRMYVTAHGDPHSRAKEAHAFGLVAKAQHGVTFALPLLHEAFGLYRSASSNWRAAVVALDIYELVGDAAMLQYAQEHAARIPQSWLARRVRRLAEVHV